MYIIRRPARPGIYSWIFYASQCLTRICFSKCNIHKGAKSKRTFPKLVGLQVSILTRWGLFMRSMSCRQCNHRVHVRGSQMKRLGSQTFLAVHCLNQCLDVPWHSQFTICVRLKIENSRYLLLNNHFWWNLILTWTWQYWASLGLFEFDQWLTVAWCQLGETPPWTKSQGPWRPSPRPSLTPGPHISEVRHCGQGVLGRFQPLSSAVDVFSKSWLYPTMSAWLPTGVPIYSLSSMSCAGPKAWSDLDVPRWSLEFPMACDHLANFWTNWYCSYQNLWLINIDS
jgi:hypothetical protein